MLGAPLAQNGRSLALLEETAISTAVSTATTPITGLLGLEHVVAQCAFTYGSGGTAADFFIQTSFDRGTTWTDIAAFRFPGTSGRLATDFDGSNDYYSLGSGLTDAADGKLGLCSFWFRIDGGDGGSRYILDSIASRVYVVLNAANKVFFVGKTGAGVNKLVLGSNTALTSSATWRHIVASWNLATGTAHVYVDDSEDQAAGATLDDSDINYIRTAWAFGAAQTAATKWDGGVAEFYYALEYLPINVEANRRKFISPTGQRVNLGADGSIPTGTQPIIYARDGDASDNLGYGGNFTANGSPTSIAGPAVTETRFQAMKSMTAVGANQSNSDGALTQNTILDGVMGDSLRVKYVTTGTFSDTTIKIDAVARG